MTLYEIADIYAKFLRAVEDGLIPDEAIADTLEGIQGEADEKVDNIACLIKNLKAEADAIREEARKLSERARSKEAHAERLKSYLEGFLPSLGYGKEKRFESPRNRISWRKSASVTVQGGFGAWALEHRPDLLKFEPRLSDIKAALKGGETVEHATITEKESMSIS